MVFSRSFTDALAAALADQHSERRTVWLTLAGAALPGTAALSRVLEHQSEGPASPPPVVFSGPPPNVPPTVPPKDGGQPAKTDDERL